MSVSSTASVVGGKRSMMEMDEPSPRRVRGESPDIEDLIKFVQELSIDSRQKKIYHLYCKHCQTFVLSFMHEGTNFPRSVVVEDIQRYSRLKDITLSKPFLLNCPDCQMKVGAKRPNSAVINLDLNGVNTSTLS